MTEQISLTGLALALLLPWGLGCVWMHTLFTRSDQPVNWAVVTGVGYFAGVFFTTLVIQLWDAANLKINFWYIASLLSALCAIGWAIRGKSNPVGLVMKNQIQRSLVQTAVIGLLIALMVWRQITLVQELAIRPIWGWDTWMNWAPKAIVWWHSGELVQFVSPEQWLLQPAGDSNYTLGNIRAWAYPPAVPLILLWSMSGAGTWDHTLLYLPWLLVSINLGLALYGHLRLAGSSTMAAVVASYFLLNMPFINVHSAVAGYADIWLSAAFGLAIFALHEWHKSRQWSWGLVCIFFGLMCSQLKIPGLVLSAIVLVTILRSMLKLRWRTELVIFTLLLVVMAAAIVWGFTLEIPYLGSFSMHEGNIAAPLFGNFEFNYHPVSVAFIEALLLSINWNIVWYLLLPVLLLKLASRAFLVQASNELLALFMVAVFIGLVFYFTPTYANALDHTTLSRAVLLSAPVLIFYIFLGLQLTAPPDRGRQTF